MDVHGQCTIDELFGEPILIEDMDTTHIRIRVENARVNTLGDNFQGLCGVKLNFEHTNISDLNFTLVAPNGQQLILIGPATGVGVTPTLFPVSHDIEFRQRVEIVSPDPGFADIWSNENLSWGTNAEGYTGTYYPFSGDLNASFAGGTVEGVWELIVIDAFTNQQGVLNSFELEFCEVRQPDCSPCETRVGAFSTEILGVCRGEMPDLDTIYTSANYDSSLYRDGFLIYQGDSLVQVSSAPDFSSISDGTNYIYAINTLISDYDSIVNESQGVTREIWVDSLQQPGGNYCVSISTPLIIDISSPVEFIADPVTLCSGDSTLFDGRYIKETGTYVMRIGGCDTLVSLDVVASSLQIAELEDTVFLDCASSSILLDGTSMSDSSVRYQWLDSDGVLISDSAFANITSIGTYSLNVDDGICPDNRLFEVVSPLDTMSLALMPSTIDLNCVDTFAVIKVETNFSYDSIRWTRTGEYVRTSDSIRLMEGGTYEALVFGSNGCNVRESVIISQDDRESIAIMVLDTITCANPMAEFRVTIIGPPAISITWRDEDGDAISSISTSFISEPGDYTVEVVNDNLCENTLSFSAEIDTSVLEIEGVADSSVLTCESNTLTLELTAQDLVQSYWLDPNNDTISNVNTATISAPGRYIGGAIGDNGCVIEEDIIIEADTIAPLVELTGVDLDCNNRSTTITAVSSQSNVSYNWSGVIDTFMNNTAIATETGGVSVEVIDTLNGCTSAESIIISSDFNEPDIIIAGPARITCDRPSIRIENVSLEMLNGFWISPLDDTTFLEVIEVDIPGMYTYVGTGSNGCSRSGTKLIMDDRDGPQIELPDLINFDCDSSAMMISVSDTIDAVLQWVINQDTTISNNILVANTSEVISIATGDNGCAVTQVIPVIYDTIHPIISVPNDTLTCLRPVVSLQNGTLSDDYLYQWEDDLGVQLSNNEVLDVSEPQTIDLTIIDTSNSCLSSEVIVVEIDTISPDLIIDRSDSITCLVDSISASILSSIDSGILWSGSGIDGDTSSTVVIVEGGTYEVVLTSTNGCTTSEAFDIIEDVDRPNLIVEDSITLTCDESEVVVVPQILDLIRPDLIWEVGNVTIDTDSFLVSTDDNIVLRALSANGCDTTFSISTSYDTIAPVAFILSSDTIVCSGEPIIVTSSSSAASGLSYQWLLNDTDITGDIDQVSIDSSGIVRYRLELNSNGCFSMDSVNIQISEQPLLDVNYSLNNETCLGDNDGLIGMIDTDGGVGALDVFIDGNAIDQDMTPLNVGFHEITVVDALGCNIAESFNIEQGVEFSLSLPDRVEVFRDDSILLVPVYQGGIPVIAEWVSENGQFSSIDSLRFLPTVDQIITLTATSAEGCIRQDATEIDVITDFSKIELYVPTIMNLNSVNQNDVFIMQLPDDVLSMDSFTIYDRWGQEVVSLGPHSNRDPFVIWDGTFGGANVASGVYVYIYQITTSEENRQKIVSGDITIIK